MSEIDEEYIQLVTDHLNVTSDACQELLLERNWWEDDGRPVKVRQAEMDRRRAELWKQHLDAAGLTIGRKEVPIEGEDAAVQEAAQQAGEPDEGNAGL